MKTKLTLTALTAVLAVLTLSLASSRLWGEKPEKAQLPVVVVGPLSATVAEFGAANGLPLEVVRAAFQLAPGQETDRTLAQTGLSETAIQARVTAALIHYQEKISKNWWKIFLKFALWLGLLQVPFLLLRRQKTSPRLRLATAAGGVLLFGVALGADPSPMGTVKDAVFLLSAHQTVFLPRLVALGVFLAIVVLANKFICAWGCQFGLLQELLFRFGRNAKDRKGIIRQFKPPFWLTNGVRIAVFAVAVGSGLAWAFDLIGEVDPFKVFSPLHITLAGAVLLLLLLVASLFIYRPWCHLACPFGLVSWLVEKLAVFRIKVDYAACIRCDACARSCPSTVMDAILKQKSIVPDCFACGTCIESCPTNAVSFTASRKHTGRWTEEAVSITAEDSPKSV